MNERLKELMLEAGYAAPELAGRANKLAELIVEECIKTVHDKGETYSAYLIEKHFGVEEQEKVVSNVSKPRCSVCGKC